MGAALLGLQCVWCVVSPVCQCMWCLQAGVQVHGIVQLSVLLLCSYCCLLSVLSATQYCILCCWRAMSDKADTPRAGSVSNPLKPLSNFSSDLHGMFIAISCGSCKGQLYLDKIQNVSSKRVTSKCILSAGRWYTPGEFEGAGGKGKFKSWRRSIFHDGLPIGDYSLSSQPNDTTTSLSSQSVDTVVDTVPGSPATSSPGKPVSSEGMESTQSPQSVVNAVLAFVKAYRLKGDVCSLKTAVLDKFDSFLVESAKKELFSVRKDCLQASGLVYKQRRSSEKRDQAKADLEDILSAFDALDSSNNLPEVFCEAADLLLLPPICLDPVSEQVAVNTKTLVSLNETFESLKTQLATSITSIEKELKALKTTGSLGSSMATTHNSDKSLLGPHPSCPTHPLVPSTSANAVSSPTILPDRSANLVLFGLPESHSLSETQAIVADILEHLAGRSIAIKDFFRLGRRLSPGSDSNPRPRPLLVKLTSVWERRLVLAGRRSLKSFRITRLFIREDLTPEQRTHLSRRSHKSSAQATNVTECATSLSQPSNVSSAASATILPPNDP